MKRNNAPRMGKRLLLDNNAQKNTISKATRFLQQGPHRPHAALPATQMLRRAMRYVTHHDPTALTG